MKSSSGYEIYHNTLSGVLDEVERYVKSKGYEVGDYFPLINHVAYGQTERTQLELLKNGSPANTLAIQIYRMDSGRYELNCYPVRKFAGGGYTRPAYDLKTTGVYSFRTNKGTFTLASYLFEKENNIEDSLEIQDELRGLLGSINIKNSAWKRLASGKSIKARSTKNNYVGILTRLDDIGNAQNYTLSAPEKFSGGGSTDDEIDLFEDYDNIPVNVKSILDRYMEEFGGDGSEMNYQDTANMLEEVEAEGYTFEYGLDNQPYGLRPIARFKTGGRVKSLKVGDKFLYKFDNRIYEVVSIDENVINLHNTKGKWWDNRSVYISLMDKWLKDKTMVKQK